MRPFKAFWPLFVFSVASNVLLLVTPLHLMQIYDRVLSSGSSETLFYITLIAILCLCLYGVTEALRSLIAQRISAQYAIKNADPVFKGMTNGVLPIEKSQQAIRDFDNVRSFISSRVLISLFDLPFAPLFLLLLFVLHFQIGLLTTFGAGLLIAIALFNKSSTAQDQETVSKKSMAALGFGFAVAQRSEDIRAMGLLPSLVQRWGEYTGSNLAAMDSAASKTAVFYGISKATRQIIQISIMAWGAYLVLNGDMSGGMIFAASLIAGRVLQPIEQIIGGWDLINRARKSHHVVTSLMAKIDAAQEKITQPEPKGFVAVKNVSFKIETDNEKTEILHDVSFELIPGKIAAIVGPSGAGKSTIARILAGITRPTEGDVLLDGCAQENWPVEQWGRNVGYLGQDVLLFPGTISENIARMSISPDEMRVISAAQLAGCHEMINSLPKGYMTKIGDDGARLSGGQSQRIALARALYTAPKLLVLDEPNAHLDQQSEDVLMKCLQYLKKYDTTILLITQREKILQIADKVLVTRNGTIFELDQDKLAAKNSKMPNRTSRQSEAVKRLNPVEG